MSLNNNDINKIKLPKDFDDRLKGTIKTAYLKKSRKRNKNKKIAVAAAVAFTVTGGFLVTNPEYVEATVNKIKEVFAKRNYNLVLEDGSTNYMGSYEIEHSNYKFKFNIDTSVSGIIKINQEIDSSKVNLDDWKLKNNKYNVENIMMQGDLKKIDIDFQRKVYEKIYKNEDITKELKYIDENTNKDEKYILETIEIVKRIYEWGVSDNTVSDDKIKEFLSDDFLDYNMEFYINGEQIYDDYVGGLNNPNNFQLRIPEKYVGKKNLDFKIVVKNIRKTSFCGVCKSEEKSTDIKLVSTSGETSVKYIPINYTYKIDDFRETTVNEVVIYPDGRVDLLYNHGKINDENYKINTFTIENSDGTEITSPGGGGKFGDDYKGDGEIKWSQVPYRKFYNGKVTGDYIKIIPDVHYIGSGESPDNMEEKMKEAQTITVKIK